MTKTKKLLGSVTLVVILSLAGCSSGDDGESAQTTSVCAVSHLSLCTSEGSCIGASGNWYDESCHSDPSSSWNQMEWDNGQWK